MRRLLFLSVALPLLATACSAERFSIKQRSCGDNFTRWTGGLTYHLLKGNQRMGTWAYDPAGDMEKQNTGSYDFGDGDFSWTVRFHDDHYRERVQVEGYGYAVNNGDLDVEYVAETEDVNGDEWAVEVREERIGCEVVRRVRDGEDTLWEEGVFSGGVYRADRWYHGEEDFVIERTERPDGTWTEVVDVSGYESEENGDADGYSRDDWWQEASDGTTFEGYTETFLDGSRHVSYEVSNGAEWDYTYDYDGDGEGTYRDSGGSCDLTYTDFQCTYDCGGETGSCS